MEDNQEKPKLKLSEKPQADEEEQPKLREISKEELKQILEDHKKWLASEGKEGKMADLRKTNLQQAKLGAANLQKADLWESNLQKADLGAVNLQEAYLGPANLQKAYLGSANLQKANLKKADLKGAYLGQANLQGAYLVGANLQGADLVIANLQGADLEGDDLHEASFVGANLKNANLNRSNLTKSILDNIKGLSAANLQYANLEGATGLLGNEFAQADVTGTKLPEDIKKFKALDIVEKTSQNARKIFFAMLLGCVYSWLTIATTTDVRLLTNTASSPLPIIGTEIPIAWFYLAAPLVLICLYFYFHLYLDNLWKGLAGLPAIFPDGKPLDQTAYPWLLNSVVCRHFERLKKRPTTAHMKEWITIFLAWWVVPLTMIGFWLRYLPRHEWGGTFFHIALIAVSVAFAIIFYRLCALTLQGKKKADFKLIKFWRDRRFYYGMIIAILGTISMLLSNHAFTNWGADFREKDVSIKPNDYYKIDSVEKQIESVKGANLRGRNLKFADMYSAFLVKADLRRANLQGADLRLVDLQKANLEGADLQKAYLGKPNLQGANLRKANLQGATIWGANLQKADLRFANLQLADLSESDLQKANLVKANLQEANLVEANFKQADLELADLQKAKLEGTNFQEANLEWVNLQGVKNLTIEQLRQVKTLYNAKLDLELREQVIECCPQLLQELKKDTNPKK